MANETINFNLPSPYQAEMAKIAQQKKMAEMLQAQSLQPTERYSYKGIEAHTPATAGLAKILQAMSGAYLQKQGLEEQKALGERYRADQMSDMTSLANSLNAPAVAGSAAVAEMPERPGMVTAPGFAPTQAMDEEGQPVVMPATAAKPAIPARPAGYVDPQMISQMKTQEGSNQMLALILAQKQAQLERDKPYTMAAGSSRYMPVPGGPDKLISGGNDTDWSPAVQYDDKGNKIHGYVNKKAPNPESTFRPFSTENAPKVPVDTVDDKGNRITKYVNPNTIGEGGVVKPLTGFLGELTSMGYNINDPKLKPILANYVAHQSGGYTDKDIKEFQFKAANLGLTAQRAAYEIPGGGANIPSAPKPFDISSPGVAPGMPPAAPAQMPVQPQGVAPQPNAAKLANVLKNMPTAPTATPAMPNTAPMPGGFDISKLSPKDRNELLKNQIKEQTGPLTETQGKATGFATRALQADKILNEIGEGGKIQPGVIKRSLEAIPLIGGSLGTLSNFTQSDEQQQIEQAQRNFVNAILRQESGASISPGEFQNAIIQYFPQPSDKTPVIKQKEENRKTAIKALEVQSGPGLNRMNNSNKIPRYNPATGKIE